MRSYWDMVPRLSEMLWSHMSRWPVSQLLVHYIQNTTWILNTKTQQRYAGNSIKNRAPDSLSLTNLTGFQT